eukprot:TRINITY_DN36264_c0_g1_i1.p1 TRINITY_DN36264_c0_g1~~TRINITY_DN36264_c0_g1_i1.p1  ORF type:complete len:268 (+),score=84.86 TRINITY_DN36264_c0_g1_i1:60-863(+)
MKVIVSSVSDDGGEPWRKQVTLPKAWLSSPCERLRHFVIKSYNQAHSQNADLDPDAWHLCCETDGLQEAIGDEDLISEVVLASDELVLRPGPGPARSSKGLRGRAVTAAPDQAARAAALVPLEMEVLEALRHAVEADDGEAFKKAVEQAGLETPHEVPIAEKELKDDSGVSLGIEYYGLPGRFGWDTNAEGQGEEASNRCSLAEFAERKKAMSILRVIELADRCGIRISGTGEGRDAEEIAASAQSVSGMVSEMQRQMEASRGQVNS